MKEDDMLVSCAVVSYNSAATVIETLESIKAQTYQNIELIVSDDCSKDDTVKLCRDWIEKNKERFVRTKLLSIEKNTGVAGNCNRALAECHGIWEKGVAADDILLPNCVKDFVDYIKKHSDAKWIASEVAIYKETFEDKNCTERHHVSDRSFFELTAKHQLKYMAFRNVIYAPSIILNVDFIRSVGGFDEQYGYEDRPFYIKALENGYKCYFLDKETVGYRVHPSAFHASGKIFNYSFLLKARVFERERCFNYLTRKQRFLKRVFWAAQDIIDFLGLNREGLMIIRKVYGCLVALILKLSNYQKQDE